MFASIIEFFYEKIENYFGVKREKDKKDKDKLEEEKLALNLYDGLHPAEKYRVNYCIVNNEYVFEMQYLDQRKYGEDWYKEHDL